MTARRWFIRAARPVVLLLVLSWLVGIRGTADAARTGGTSGAPPASINHDCGRDVSSALSAWLNRRPPGTVVRPVAGACYLVDLGIRLNGPQGLTIDGGLFRSQATYPTGGVDGFPAITVVGGKDVTLKNLRIVGVNPGGYHADMELASGIWFDGTFDPVVRGVTISRVYGDGVTLAPLRGGATHNSGTIVAPTTGAVIRNVVIEGAGRQGITFASVSGAQVKNVTVERTGFNSFDFEADQRNEGASDVTIDGCSASDGTLFFANAGSGGAHLTHDITVEDCRMGAAEGGTAILVTRPGNGNGLRGPVTFRSDSLWCGSSAYVACIELSGADLVLSDSTLRFPTSSPHEPVYRLQSGSRAVFADDVVEGYGAKGASCADCSLSISGGRWTAAPTRV